MTLLAVEGLRKQYTRGWPRRVTFALQADFTIEEARDYLINEALPGVQSVVTSRLEEAGVSSGE